MSVENVLNYLVLNWVMVSLQWFGKVSLGEGTVEGGAGWRLKLLI